MTTAELEQLAEQMLSKKRFRHTLFVRDQAILLAKCYNVEIKPCETAALLHDITKELGFEKQLQMLLQSDIMANDIIFRTKQLHHAVTGAIYAHQTLGIIEENICQAIRYHTTGRAGMSVTEKIVFIADATSQDRKYKEVEHFRELALVDLDLCMYEMIRHNIRYLIKDGCQIPNDTLDAYNEYAGKAMLWNKK